MKINDVIEQFISGDWGCDTSNKDTPYSVRCIRGADIEPIKKADYDNIPERFVNEKSIDIKCLQCGDIVIEKSGGSPTQSTGRTCFVSKELLAKYPNIVCTNFCVAIRVKPEWDAKYIYLYLQFIYNCGIFFNFEGKTSGLKNLQLEQAFNSIEIKKLSISQQKEIVSILEPIEKKISLNRQINRNLAA